MPRRNLVRVQGEVLVTLPTGRRKKRGLKKGDPVDEVSLLKRELDGRILVLGSIRLVRALLEHDLVDELRLIVFPVALGAGERLFGETSQPKPMRLVDTRVGDDVAFLVYEPAREPRRYA